MIEERRGEIRAAKNEQKLDEIESQFPVDRLDLLQDAWLNSVLRRALAINSASTMNNVVSGIAIPNGSLIYIRSLDLRYRLVFMFVKCRSGFASKEGLCI